LLQDRVAVTEKPPRGLGDRPVALEVDAVPICWYGFTQNDFVQRWLGPIFLVGLAWLVYEAVHRSTLHPSFTHPGLTLAGVFGALGALLPNVVIQVLGTGDFSRFIRKTEVRRAMVVGPFVVIAAVYLVSFPIGAVPALYTGSANPGTYLGGFLGSFGVVWITATQLRINNMNFYSGSLALANFSSRILHWVPGRRFWVLITGGVAFVGAMAHVEEHLIKVVAFMGLFCLAWLGVLIADICVLKTKLRIAPTHVEHRRGYLANWESHRSAACSSARWPARPCPSFPSRTPRPVRSSAMSSRSASGSPDRSSSRPSRTAGSGGSRASRTPSGSTISRTPTRRWRAPPTCWPAETVEKR
jgi:purine-cytosine permease-like protein